MPVKLAYGPSFIDTHFYSEAEITFTGKGSTGSEKEQDSVWGMLVEHILFCSLSCGMFLNILLQHQWSQKSAVKSCGNHTSIAKVRQKFPLSMR